MLKETNSVSAASSIGELYERQEKDLKRPVTFDRDALSEAMMTAAGGLQIIAGALGLISIGELSVYSIFSNVILILLCVVIIVMAVIVVFRRSVGEAFCASILGIFVGGPCLSSTILALISLLLVLASEKIA